MPLTLSIRKAHKLSSQRSKKLGKHTKMPSLKSTTRSALGLGCVLIYYYYLFGADRKIIALPITTLDKWCTPRNFGSMPGFYQTHDGTDNWVINYNATDCIINNKTKDLIPSMPLTIKAYNEIQNITKPRFFFLGDSVARRLAVRFAQLYANSRDSFTQERAKEECAKVKPVAGGGHGAHRGGFCTFESSSATIKFAWVQWAWLPAPVKLDKERITSLWNGQRADRCLFFYVEDEEDEATSGERAMNVCLRDFLPDSGSPSDVMVVRLGLEYILYHDETHARSIGYREGGPPVLDDYLGYIRNDLPRFIDLVGQLFSGKLVFLLLSPILGEGFPAREKSRAGLAPYINSTNNVIRKILHEHQVPYIEPFANLEYYHKIGSGENGLKGVGYVDPIHFGEPMLTTFSRLVLNTAIGI